MRARVAHNEREVRQVSMSMTPVANNTSCDGEGRVRCCGFERKRDEDENDGGGGGEERSRLARDALALC